MLFQMQTKTAPKGCNCGARGTPQLRSGSNTIVSLAYEVAVGVEA